MTGWLSWSDSIEPLSFVSPRRSRRLSEGSYRERFGKTPWEPQSTSEGFLKDAVIVGTERKTEKMEVQIELTQSTGRGFSFRVISRSPV